MLQLLSVIEVKDNSGVLKVRMIRNKSRNNKHNYARIGDIIKASILKKRRSDYKKGQLIEIMIVNTVRNHEEKSVYTSFKTNAGIVINRDKKGAYPAATKVFAPVLKSTVSLFTDKHRKVFENVIS
jgi:ribosomal protein L14